MFVSGFPTICNIHLIILKFSISPYSNTVDKTVLTAVFSLQGEFPNYGGGHYQIMSEKAMTV